MRAWRNPLIPAGFVLVVIGVGNWSVGATKVQELQLIRPPGQASPPIDQFEEFGELSARTNATLLRPLQGGNDRTRVIADKLDFYRVVQTGGRVLTLLGLFIAAAGLIHSWSQRHAGAAVAATPHRT